MKHHYVRSGSRKRKPLTMALTILLIASGLLGLLVIEADTAQGTTLIVGPGNYDTITDALDNASSGDTILILSGIYYEALTVNVTGLTIMGSSPTPRINFNSTGPIFRIITDNVTISDLEINGDISISSNNTVLRNLTMMPFDRVAISINNSTGTSIENVTIAPVDTKGIEIYNGRNISIYDVTVNTSVMGTGIWVNNSMNVSIGDFRSLGSNTGIICLGSNDLNIFNSTFNSSGNGIEVTDTKNIKVHKVNFTSANGMTGALLTNCTDVDLQDVMFSVGESSRGLEDHGSGGISINGTYLEDTGQNSMGMSMILTKDLHVSGSTFSTGHQGSKGVFLDNTNISKFTDVLFDNTGDLSTSLFGSSCISTDIRNNTFDTGGEMSKGLDMEMGMGDIISSNHFITRGVFSGGLSIRNGFSTELSNNMIYAEGNHSVGAMVDMRGLAYGNIISVSGFMASGMITMGNNLTVQRGRINVNGENSTGFVILNSRDLSIRDVLIDVKGSNGTGILSMGESATFSLSNLDMDLDAHAGSGVDVKDQNAIMSLNGSDIDSDSPEAALILTGRNVIITNTNISSDVGMMIFDLDECLIFDTRVSSWTSINATRSMLEIHGSDISSTLVAEEFSFVRAVDSIIRLVNVSETATISIEYTMGVKLLTKDGDPFEGVEVELTLDGVPFYSTPRFGGMDPLTSPDGRIPYFRGINRIYEGENTPTFKTTEITIFSRGTADRWDATYVIDTSYSHLVPFTSPDIDLPARPQGLKIIPLEIKEAFFLSWDRNHDDTIEYIIYWYNTSSSGWEAIGRTVNNSFETNDLGPDFTAFFRVSSWDGVWESEHSLPESNTTMDLTPPGRVINLASTSSFENAITLSWSIPATDDLLEFVIEMNRSGSHSSFIEIMRVPKDLRTATVASLVPGSEYSFRMYALDDNMNPSEMSSVIRVSTLLPKVGITIYVAYGEGGPMSLLPARNSTVDLMEFNGTTIISSTADDQGSVYFRTTVSQATQVRIRAHAEELLRGEKGFRSGYLDNITDFILLTGTTEDMVINLTLDHYMVPSQGLVRVRVMYGEGPRTGYIENAAATLFDDGDNTVETKLTNADGEAAFRIYTLPFRGYFIADPPDILAGIEGERSGYLTGSTNFFELTNEKPEWGYMDLNLPYYEYRPPPLDLEMLTFGPRGDAVILTSSIVITFNQPVDGESVKSSILFDPPLKEPRFMWSNGNMTLTIKHEGFVPETEYRITLTTGARSLEGTTFAETAVKEWSFTTSGLDEETQERRISTEFLIGAAGVIVLAFIILIILFVTRSSRKENELDEDRQDDDFYDEYDDEDYEELDEDDMEYEDEDEDYEELDEDDMEYEDELEDEDHEDMEEIDELEQIEDELDDDLDPEEKEMLEKIEKEDPEGAEEALEPYEDDDEMKQEKKVEKEPKKMKKTGSKKKKR